MRQLVRWALICITLILAACNGEDNTTDGPNNPSSDSITISITSLIENYTSASVKVTTKGADTFAYIAESQANKGYTAEEVFNNGVTANCNKSSTTSFTLSDLIDNTKYTLYVVAKDKEGVYSDVVSRTFTTKSYPEFSIISKNTTGFKATIRLPESVPTTSVVKWAITDLASYNLNGGNGSEDYWLNRNEAIYNNYFVGKYDLDINPNSRTFTKDGTTYAWYEPITPGQPIILLFGQYAEGSHSAWGEGYYSPHFGQSNPSGYFRKETIVTTKPTTINTKADVSINIHADGKGTISISAPSEIVKYRYLILDEEKYSTVRRLLDNNVSYLQWFTTSTLAKEQFGAVEAKGTIQIDASQLNMKADTEYHLFITAYGDNEGTKQSFVSHTFTLVPNAPEPCDNIIIAHRGGSKEAGVPDNSIASLKYAMSLGCYASEADIYWTKDNKIIVAHANSECKINGLYPWENTLADIQAAGKLSNGETIPSLEDYIRTVMVSGSKTKLCLDIKAITKPTYHHPESVKACQRACEIIVEMGAQNFCQFICSGWEDIVKHCATYANNAGIEIGAMGKFSASQYKNWGYTWHNRDKGYDISLSKIQSYLDAGMEVSVFTLDSDSDWALINSHYTKLKGITTNYPKKFISKFRQ